MLCNKCRQAPPREGDTWCIACSAWESVGVGLGGRWTTNGLRDTAAEAVVGAARLVRSLKNLDASLVAQSKSQATKPKPAGGATAVKEEKARSPLPRTRSSSAFPLAAQRGGESEYTYEDEESEEEEIVDKNPKAPRKAESVRGSDRPAEPPYPPRSKREEVEQDKAEDKKKDRRDREHGHKEKKEKGEKRHRGQGQGRRRKRGGRKHKRLARTLENPETPVHRALPQDYWEQDLARRSHLSPGRGQ